MKNLMYRLQKISSEFFSWKKNYSGRQNLFAIRFCHPQLVKDTEKFTKSCVFDYKYEQEHREENRPLGRRGVLL